MSVIVLLIVAGGTVAAGFLAAFVWAVRSGQFDDTCTPAIRMLLEDGGQTQRPMRLPPEGGSHREGGGMSVASAFRLRQGLRRTAVASAEAGQAEENIGETRER